MSSTVHFQFSHIDPSSYFFCIHINMQMDDLSLNGIVFLLAARYALLYFHVF